MKIWLVEKLPQGNHSVAENHSVALALAAATEVQVSEDKVEENKNYQVYEKKKIIRSRGIRVSSVLRNILSRVA